MRRHRKLNNGGRCTTTEISSRIRQSLVLFLIASSVVMAQQPCGSFVCENGGQCLDLFQQRTNSSLLSKIQVSGDLLLQCICPPGYGGITCSYNHGQICDGSKKKQCKNNSPCIANKLVPNVTECPCDAAYTLSNFAGDMCEQPATEYCQLAWSHESQEQHFCTNGGRCIGTDTSPTDDTGISEEGYTWGMVMGDTPIGCQCPPEFEGEHCEILIGMVSTAPAARSGKSPAWRKTFFTAFFLSFFFSTAVISAALYIRWKYIGIHVTPNHGEEEKQQEAKVEEDDDSSPTSVVDDRARSKKESSKGFDFDEMIEIEEDMEEAQFV